MALHGRWDVLPNVGNDRRTRGVCAQRTDALVRPCRATCYVKPLVPKPTKPACPDATGANNVGSSKAAWTSLCRNTQGAPTPKTLSARLRATTLHWCSRAHSSARRYAPPAERETAAHEQPRNSQNFAASMSIAVKGYRNVKRATPMPHTVGRNRRPRKGPAKLADDLGRPC